jgi:hypothetical protein
MWMIEIEGRYGTTPPRISSMTFCTNGPWVAVTIASRTGYECICICGCSWRLPLWKRMETHAARRMTRDRDRHSGTHRIRPHPHPRYRALRLHHPRRTPAPSPPWIVPPAFDVQGYCVVGLPLVTAGLLVVTASMRSCGRWLACRVAWAMFVAPLVRWYPIEVLRSVAKTAGPFPVRA